jgi:hypothetical protein
MIFLLPCITGYTLAYGGFYLWLFYKENPSGEEYPAVRRRRAGAPLSAVLLLTYSSSILHRKEGCTLGFEPIPLVCSGSANVRRHHRHPRDVHAALTQNQAKRRHYSWRTCMAPPSAEFAADLSEP